ncbi:hypothetical protein TNCV_3080161 [Trichonephila clavipes]|nr:hypothetical protein TNCV_3080161 [Trichonephila clavipes]
MIEKHDEHETKGKFSYASEEHHQLKYEAISDDKLQFTLSKNTRKKKFNLLFVVQQRCHEFEPSTTKDPSYMGKRLNGRVIAYCASKPQVWGSIHGLDKFDSAFHSFNESKNEYHAFLRNKHWVSRFRQTDQDI